MSDQEKVNYTARVHTVGGREDGTSRSDDGRLDVELSLPGTKERGTNPEQMFAAAWSACFLSAIKLVAGKRKITLPRAMAIDAEVDERFEHGNFSLAARLNVSLPGINREVTQFLIESAHQICPYSRATRGNIDVTFSVVDSGLRKAG